MIGLIICIGLIIWAFSFGPVVGILALILIVLASR